MKIALILFLLCVGAVSQAQVYSAPGMPLSLHGSSVAQAAKIKALAVKKPFVGVRFWQLKDSARVKAATDFYRFLQSQFRWPSTTISNGVEGRVSVRLLLLPNGSIQEASIIGRELEQANGYPAGDFSKGSEALDAAIALFAKKLRFEPATTTDTMRFSINFRLE